jgi:hypothetical protein
MLFNDLMRLPESEWVKHISSAGIKAILTKRAEKLEKEAATLRRLAADEVAK